MTKAAALQAFFSSFGIKAYPAEDAPDGAAFPWLTYTHVTGAWGEKDSITVNLWYYDENNVTINAKAQQISTAISAGGKLVACDGGAIWITRGSPWCQSLREPSDHKIKRRYLNVDAEFLTPD